VTSTTAGHLFERLDGVSVPTPAAGDLDDLLVDHLFLLDAELTADREVMERPGSSIRQNVEPGQVAAGCTSIASRGHGVKANGRGEPVIAPST
jgi:hypothetical protein